MKGRMRRTSATHSVARGAVSNVQQLGQHLPSAGMTNDQRERLERDLRNLAGRITAAADDVATCRLNASVTAQLAAGWLDVIGRIVAGLVSDSAVTK